MKKIDTLVADIYEAVDKGVEVSHEDASAFADDFAKMLKGRLSERRGNPYLRISNLGTKCDRKLWFNLNRPELAEPLLPHVKLKFLMGDVWEAVLLFLARVSGHKVEGTQDEIELHGVKGHRDAVIDGTIVDVKSASSFSFKKFEEGLTPEKDEFGYLTQLDSYLEHGQNDEIVTNKEEAAFLAGDKQLGTITLDRHKRLGVDYEKLVQEKQKMLSQTNPPPRAFQDVPDGKSGNRKLDTHCSYCDFKFACWPGLEKYNYSGRPRYLTVVKKAPRVSKEGEAQSDDPF